MRGLIHLVVVFRLEHQMADLPAGHRYQPRQQCGQRGILEHDAVGDDEGDGAEKMQSLVDAAMVVITVVVPALNFEELKEAGQCCFLLWKTDPSHDGFESVTSRIHSPAKAADDSFASAACEVGVASGKRKNLMR